MRTDHAQELEAALGELATSLQKPVVSGDLVEWVAGVRAAAQPVYELLHRQVEIVRPADCAQIMTEDPEQARNVQQLKDGDRESLSQFTELLARIDQLSQKAPRREPDEGSMTAELKALVDDGLAFVLHAQKQEVAARTWLHEAFNRDRGTVD
ncbi:MAG: hypothetical protein HYS13_08165 [Planctomycetia bacterium]|nr:hypothetical protein [Planctomycetia bacterium]